MVRHVVENFGGGQPVMIELKPQIRHIYRLIIVKGRPFPPPRPKIHRHFGKIVGVKIVSRQ
jgi:hypothetical protein